MPNKYKPMPNAKKRAQVSEDAIVAALKLIKIDKKTVNSTAKTYQIPERTLNRYSKKLADDVTEWSDELFYEFVRKNTGYKQKNEDLQVMLRNINLFKNSTQYYVFCRCLPQYKNKR